MKKRILLTLVAVVLAGVAGAGYWVYSQYLEPDQLVDKLREVLEDAIGAPLELGAARVTGLSTIQLDDIQIPAAGELAEGEAPWLRVESATVRLRLVGLLPGQPRTLHLDLTNPSFHLKRNELGGWNFLVKRKVPPVATPNNQRQESRRESGDSAVRLAIVAEDAALYVEDSSWGKWDVRFPGTVRAVFERGTRDLEHLLLLSGDSKVEGGIPDTKVNSLRPLLRDLISTTDPSHSTSSFDVRIAVSDDDWEVASRGAPGFRYEDRTADLTVRRFRVSGLRTDEGKTTLSDAAIDEATIGLSSWDNAVIQNLKLPWAEIPSGEMRVNVGDFRYDGQRVGLNLSGARIGDVTLSAGDLPWLHICSNRRGWRLEDVELETHLDISADGQRVDWSDATMTLAGGKGGTFRSRGFYAMSPLSDWKLTVEVNRFPIPEQQIDADTSYLLGAFSGMMTWGKNTSPGEGKVVLNDGEIGSIRLLGGIDRLLDLKDLAQSSFDEFSFDFQLSEDAVEISQLALKSPVLRMTGKGLYGPGQHVDIEIAASPGKGLASAVKSETASSIIEGVAGGTSPVTVRITGDLDNPSYRFTAGEGMKIPIGKFKLDF